MNVKKVQTNNAAASSLPHPAPQAFTMIEMLVVIFILGVLAMIMVSVAGYVMSRASEQETAAIQKTVLEAIQAWHDAYYDPNQPGNKVYPLSNDPNVDPNSSGRVLVSWLTRGGADGNSSQAPYVKAATEQLLKLPQVVWNGDPNQAVKDGWGVDMHYEPRGGLGGKPVVISAGPDRRFNTEDDIRSDESQ